MKRLPDRYRREAVAMVRSSLAEHLGRTVQPAASDGPSTAGMAAGRARRRQPHLGPSLPRPLLSGGVGAAGDGAHECLATSLDHPPRTFAYPNGVWAAATESLLRRHGYETALGFDHRLTRLPPPPAAPLAAPPGHGRRAGTRRSDRVGRPPGAHDPTGRGCGRPARMTRGSSYERIEVEPRPTTTSTRRSPSSTPRSGSDAATIGSSGSTGRDRGVLRRASSGVMGGASRGSGCCCPGGSTGQAGRSMRTVPSRRPPRRAPRGRGCSACSTATSWSGQPTPARRCCSRPRTPTPGAATPSSAGHG
jgi:hypothetical protein